MKYVYAVIKDGKRMTRFRTDLVKILAIAKKTKNNLGNRTVIRVTRIGVTKSPSDTRNFAMIANEKY